MKRALVVIEAPGKVAALARHLRALGHGWPVVATRGHFVRNPQSLWPLAIDSTYRERARTPVRKIARSLREQAERRVVFIATDDDAEGDVIARDVAETVSDVADRCVRVRIRAFTAAGVKEALTRIEPFDARAARRGDARRILDRLIGHTFSQPRAPAGRILTPLLAHLQRTDPIVARVRLVVPCADGGPPWRAEIDIRASQRELWRARFAALGDARPLRIARRETLSPQHAWGYAEAVQAACGRPVPVKVGVAR